MNQFLRTVLIEPEFSGNLGSVARAMGNMGFDDLVLVNPRAEIDHKDARAMAVATYPILEQARIVDNLVEAIGDCHWIVGFTRRAGRHRREFLPITKLPETTHKHLSSNHQIAFVFGPEKRGFTTHEAATCQHLVCIPTSEEHPSLNLAAAVTIALYEVIRFEPPHDVPFPHQEATIDEMEGMYTHLDELYEAVHYFDAQNRQRIPQILRRLFNRARPTSQEIRIIRGLCRNALNALKSNKK